MAKKDRIKSKSIYTIRRKHQSVVSGTVYEHDHITILPTDGIYDDEIAFYPESNFKYKVGDNTNEKKGIQEVDGKSREMVKQLGGQRMT